MAVMVASAGLAGCGGRRAAPHAAPDDSAAARSSPCAGTASRTDDAAPGCAAFVSRVAPVRSLALSVRRSPRVRATCEDASRQAHIQVICPPLVPAHGVIANPDLYGAEGPLRPGAPSDFYLLTFNNGDNAGHIHWIVGAGRGDSVRRNLFDPRIWEVPGRVHRLRERRYGAWAMAFYRFPPYPSGGQLGGHDLALARVRGTTYFASIHGRTHHDADAAMLVAILLNAPSAP